MFWRIWICIPKKIIQIPLYLLKSFKLDLSLFYSPFIKNTSFVKLMMNLIFKSPIISWILSLYMWFIPYLLKFTLCNLFKMWLEIIVVILVLLFYYLHLINITFTLINNLNLFGVNFMQSFHSKVELFS